MRGIEFSASTVDKRLTGQLAPSEFTKGGNNATLAGGPRTSKTDMSTALHVSGINGHAPRVRIYFLVDLVNAQARRGKILERISMHRMTVGEVKTLGNR